jgi:AraC family transcriptional regulator of adaptative response / DNA-3-methyladenine glycosylase II
MPAARARALGALARAVRNGLALDGRRDVPATRAALLELPGIGPWTVEYIAMRALRDPDAFPAGDLVLRNALGGISARELLARADAWRPWRAYAAMHLWSAAAG